MAGHSKWQNIRHIKSKRDNERARTIDRMVRLIRLAVKDAGLSDPKQSSKVASAVEEARDNNVPMATIENALKSGQLEKDKLLAATLEIVGLGGSFLVVDILSPNAIKTKNILKPVLKKHGATYAQSSVMSSFDHKGVILAKKDGQTMEGALEDAIEVGAEEVTESSEEEEKLLQFMCDVPSFHVVKTGLKERGYTLHQAGLEYIPTARVKLSELELTIMDKFCHMLEENEHVVKIYDNIE
jgi:translational activator of cytochrome c oxidase 1